MCTWRFAHFSGRVVSGHGVARELALELLDLALGCLWLLVHLVLLLQHVVRRVMAVDVVQRCCSVVIVRIVIDE